MGNFGEDFNLAICQLPNLKSANSSRNKCSIIYDAQPYIWGPLFFKLAKVNGITMSCNHITLFNQV